MLFNNRNSRRSLLLEINPYQLLAAGFTRPEPGGAAVLECVAEFDTDDDASLRLWLDENFDKQKAWVPVICGFVPPEGLLQRESVQPRKLPEPDYLANLVRDQYKIENPAVWKIETLSQLEGTPLAPEGSHRPALVCGVSFTDVHRVQQRLLDHRTLPYRLELSLLPLLGVISDYKARRGDKRATVVVVIEQEHTVAYILGKEGVHTPAPVRHGFASIAQGARKEFNLNQADEVRDRLNQADDELMLRATKFVRAIGRDLKPLVDSYEMTTGQPVGEIYCAYLPPTLSWITEPLAQVVGRTPFAMDCQAWLESVKLIAGEGVPAFGQHWLGALSLLAELPGPRPDKAHEDSAYQGPWHINCRLSGNLPTNDLISGRFVARVISLTLATAAFAFGFWLLSTSHNLEAEVADAMASMAQKKRPLDQLNLTTRKLASASEKLDHAYALMAAPYQLTDLLMALGRSRPASMHLESVDAIDTGLIVRGNLNESSELANRTLRQFVESLRADGVTGTAFGSIALTSFIRQDKDEGFNFEITFRLKVEPKS